MDPTHLIRILTLCKVNLIQEFNGTLIAEIDVIIKQLRGTQQ